MSGMTIQLLGYSGFDINVGMDSLDNARLVYSAGSGYAQLLYNDNGGWEWSNPVDADNTVADVSMAIDSSDRVLFSYFAGIQDGLKHVTGYKKKNTVAPGGGKYPTTGDPWVWEVETVDDSNYVGVDCSLALDANGHSHISYLSRIGPEYDLKYATNASGSWEMWFADTAGKVGLLSDIAVDQDGYAHIAYHDHDNGDLKYATNVPQ